jgi:hypothetical protein
MRLIATITALVLASPLAAQTFDVKLGGKTLGTLEYSEKGRDATLQSTLDSTPMGVFNGTFTGSSSAKGQFIGDSKSSRKQRIVTVDITQGRATGVEIIPANEMTDLSDASRVPAGVSDPVQIIGAFIGATGCPPSTRMYDGRRVVTLTPQAGKEDGASLTCPVSYKVVAGPGHLSPLGISNAKMELLYDMSGEAQTLKEIKVSSGVFRLKLLRRD